MLSPTRIKELYQIVQKRHPSFGKKEFPNVQPAGRLVYGMPYRCKLGDFPKAISLPNLVTIGSCCGFTQFEKIIGDMNGLYSLTEYDDVEKAIFALWLNDNPRPGFTAIIAATGSPNPKQFGDQEKVLQFCGFEPLLRGYNLCHGPNHVTLWGLQLNDSTLPPGPTPPEEPQPKRRAIAA